MNIDLKQLRELMRAMKQLDVHELEIENEGERILLRRGSNGTAGAPMVATTTLMPAGTTMPPPPSMPPMSYDRPPPLANEPPVADPNIAFITSPFVGTFYRSPTPDAAPFVEVGDDIRAGTVLCIVEAMKLMNEIEAEISGTILEVLGDNGKPVEFGDKLFKIRKN